MHVAIQLVVYWGLAFLSLGIALVLLNIYFGMIGNDLQLRSAGSEAIIAGIASFVEGASLWLVTTFVPAAGRALIIPAIVVALIYKIAHFEDRGRFDVFLLLAFQVVISCFGASLIFGHFQTAIYILIGFGVVLAVIAGFSKSLWD